MLISGSGTNLQALLGWLPARITWRLLLQSVRPDEIPGLARAEDADIPTFVVDPSVYSDRAQWDAGNPSQSPQYNPDWVVSAGVHAHPRP